MIQNNISLNWYMVNMIRTMIESSPKDNKFYDVFCNLGLIVASEEEIRNKV